MFGRRLEVRSLLGDMAAESVDLPDGTKSSADVSL